MDPNATVPSPNPHSWTKLANILYIDQPVGTGYSGGGDRATLNVQVTQDFEIWLKAFYDVFPRLRSKNTYIMGESYSGIFIPYFTQAILANNNSLSVNLSAIPIGDSAFGNLAALSETVTISYMNQQNQILGITQDVLDVFDQAHQRRGFVDVLQQVTYPLYGKNEIPGGPEGESFRLKRLQRDFSEDGCVPDSNTPALFEFVNKQLQWRMCYCNNNTVLDTLSWEYVEPPAYWITPAILEAGIGIHIYSGDYDFLPNHLGTELAIQNMTWCGKQGLQAAPNNTFLVDGKNLGNWGAEVSSSAFQPCPSLLIINILGARHAVPHDQPAAAFAFIRDFVVGTIRVFLENRRWQNVVLE
ncbi:hypothetical protein ABVK25_004329 [Lepraria finkii]|uniref:Pheromone-processing carboxypeptidase KEX1 n=1 Tax=Lepraria finkii TaxID=1340010 RepID=A0ABR4BET0_9LECA